MFDDREIESMAKDPEAVLEAFRRVACVVDGLSLLRPYSKATMRHTPIQPPDLDEVPLGSVLDGAVP